MVEDCPFAPLYHNSKSDRILRKKSYERSIEKPEVRLIRLGQATKDRIQKEREDIANNYYYPFTH